MCRCDNTVSAVIFMQRIASLTLFSQKLFVLCLVSSRHCKQEFSTYLRPRLSFSFCLLSSSRHAPCSICQCLIKPFHPWSPANILYCIQPHPWPPTSRRTLLLWASSSLYSLSIHAWWVVRIILSRCLHKENTVHKWHHSLAYNASNKNTFGPLTLLASTEGRKWSWPKRGPAPIRDLLLSFLSSSTSAASFSALTVSSSRASASRASLWSGKYASDRHPHLTHIIIVP